MLVGEKVVCCHFKEGQNGQLEDKKLDEIVAFLICFDLFSGIFIGRTINYPLTIWKGNRRINHHWKES